MDSPKLYNNQYCWYTLFFQPPYHRQLYTLRPRSSAYGNAYRSPTAATLALLSNRDLAA